jgi:hypothetical protein
MKLLSPWFEARSILRENPALAQTPVPLPDADLASLSGSSVELLGMTIQTPWSKIGTIRLAPGVAAIPFPDEDVQMLLFEPESDDFEKRMRAQGVQGRGNAIGISSYKLMAAEMFTTPDLVKWWKRPAKNEATTFLLEMKAIRLGHLKGIYAISNGKLRGFQLGDPVVPPYRVRLDLFDSADRHYQIQIAPTGGHGPALSQEQINALVASISPKSGTVRPQGS